MKKRVLALILTVMLVVLSACTSGGNDVSRTYDEALNAMKQGKYAEAAETLSGISFYQDSAELSLYCRAHAKAAEGDYDFAVKELRKLGSYRDSGKSAVYFSARKAEETADGPRSRAYAAALYDQEEINGFRDSTARADSIRTGLYEEGLKAQEAESWTEAAEIFEALEEYQDSKVRYCYTAGRMFEAESGDRGTSYAYAAVCFARAGDYLDSAERGRQCLDLAYQKADQLIQKADFDGAEQIYQALGSLCNQDRLGQLREAREKAKEEARQQQIAEAEAARQQRIAEADALLEENRFDEAKKIYQEVNEPEKANEADYCQASWLAGNGEPEKAAALYMAIRDYKDSREQHYLLGNSLKETDPETAGRILLNDRDYPGVEDELYGIAVKASADGNYPLSISIYSEYTGKRDCSLRMMNDLYTYGLMLLHEDKPEMAASVFDQIPGVGSADLYADMARYAAAESLETKGSYEAAAAAFDLIKNYSDAADRADNCRYLLAKEKKEKGQYLEAEKIFAALGDREDSAEQKKNCRYLQAGVYEKRNMWTNAIELYEGLNDYADSKARCAECYRMLGEQQLANGEPVGAYHSFVTAGDRNGQARAAFAAGELETAKLSLNSALEWYKLAADLPETEERTAMIAQSLLNMEEDALAEQYASVVENSEKAKNVLYALALRSMERKDEEAAMRQIRKAGDDADESGRFREMINDRVDALVGEEKYDDAIYLCTAYGEQERADEIRNMKAQKEEEERQKALEAEEAERRAKTEEAESLLKEGKYEEAAAIYMKIGETELAAKALAEKTAAEEAARLEAEKAEKEKIQARLDEASELIAAGKYDEAQAIGLELNNREIVSEAIYQKAAALDQPELYLSILEYKDSREKHYLAGKALLDTDPEQAFRILAADTAYADVKQILYDLADRESKAGNYLLSSEVFGRLAELPLDPDHPMPDCRMRCVQDLYAYGLQLQGNGEWEAAADTFGQLSGTGKAQTHALESLYAAAGVLESNGKYTQAAVAFEELGEYSDAAARAKQNRYNAATKQMDSGDPENAESAFRALENYSDAAEMAKECRYRVACGRLEAGQYAEARELFGLLGIYSDSVEKQKECTYQIAEQYLDQALYTKAIAEYETISGYRDVNEKLVQCHATVGDQYISRAEASLREGNTGNAISLYQLAYAEYRKTGNTERTGLLAMMTAYCYSSMNDLSAALEWYEKAGKDGNSRITEITEYYINTEQYTSAEAMALEMDSDAGRGILYRLGLDSLSAGDEESALRLFTEAGDHPGAKEQHDAILYHRAEELAEGGQYQGAAEIYAQIPDYQDAADKKNAALYRYAEQLVKRELYEEAVSLYESLGDYSDANIRAQELRSKLIKTGDIIRFGRYEQDNNTANGQEKIEWIVLDYDEANHKALLISRYALDVMPYNKQYNGITWEKCTLRVWLNREFMNRAFSAKEQSAILMTAVDNSRNQGFSDWYTNGGNNTKDRIFLLSYTEANRYLGVKYDDANNKQSRVAPTAYAIAQGAYANNSILTADGEPTTLWWLRSPGKIQHYAANVLSGGSLSSSYVNLDHGVVRPALWVNLDSDLF